MEDENLTVSQVNSYISKKMNRDAKLKNIYVKGELSNYKSYPHGHDYFTLKDEKSQIKGVMFKGRKRFLEFTPKDGINVVIKGSVEVYEKNGYYQLKATSMVVDGIGPYHIAFEKLKKKLEKEGLFDQKHKKEIPKYPKRIGVVTAETGAAVKDIITTIKRRYPLCEILVFSTLVQGQKAADQIARQIEKSERYDLDTLIVGRGGGSIEDLWPFNEEIVARAIFKCETPVISAVGHEIDFTISDFVADLRAATPTAAAELAVPQIKELKFKVTQLNKRANNSITDKVQYNKNRLDTICKKQIIQNPESLYDIKQMNLDHLLDKLNNFSKNIIASNQHRLTMIENSSILKNPEEIYQQKSNKLNNLISSINYSSKSIIYKNKNRLEIVKSNNALKNPRRIYENKQLNLNSQISKIKYSSKNILSKNKNKLEIIKNSKALKNPSKIYENKQQHLNSQISKIEYSSKNILSKNKNKLEIIKNSKALKNPNDIKIKKQDKLLTNIEKLEILNPLLTLKRGYSITKKSNKVITHAKDVKKGDELDIEFNDGTINTKVI